MRGINLYRRGFTLIELLVVIAVIAVLAAILFPVFNNVRKQAALTTCMDNMRSIGQAVKLYYEDNHHYPAALYGFVEAYGSSPGTTVLYNGSGSALPEQQTRLYRPLIATQRYLKDTSPFQCPHNTVTDPSVITNAYYPLGAANNLAGQKVLYTPVMQHAMGFTNSGNPVMPAAMIGQPAWFYGVDSYDTGPAITATGPAVVPVQELHYCTDWTQSPGQQDAPNQLKYPSPPDNTTVITWCTYHVATAHMDHVPVLMLSGHVVSVPVTKWLSSGPLGFSQ